MDRFMNEINNDDEKQESYVSEYKNDNDDDKDDPQSDDALQSQDLDSSGNLYPNDIASVIVYNQLV